MPQGHRVPQHDGRAFGCDCPRKQRADQTSGFQNCGLLISQLSVSLGSPAPARQPHCGLSPGLRWAQVETAPRAQMPQHPERPPCPEHRGSNAQISWTQDCGPGSAGTEAPGLPQAPGVLPSPHCPECAGLQEATLPPSAPPDADSWAGCAPGVGGLGSCAWPEQLMAAEGSREPPWAGVLNWIHLAFAFPLGLSQQGSEGPWGQADTASFICPPSGLGGWDRGFLR